MLTGRSPSQAGGTRRQRLSTAAELSEDPSGSSRQLCVDEAEVLGAGRAVDPDWEGLERQAEAFGIRPDEW